MKNNFHKLKKTLFLDFCLLGNSEPPVYKHTLCLTASDFVCSSVAV